MSAVFRPFRTMHLYEYISLILSVTTDDAWTAGPGSFPGTRLYGLEVRGSVGARFGDPKLVRYAHGLEIDIPEIRTQKSAELRNLNLRTARNSKPQSKRYGPAAASI